jgi:hypothetical protein
VGINRVDLCLYIKAGHFPVYRKDRTMTVSKVVTPVFLIGTHAGGGINNAWHIVNRQTASPINR